MVELDTIKKRVQNIVNSDLSVDQVEAKASLPSCVIVDNETPSGAFHLLEAVHGDDNNSVGIPEKLRQVCDDIKGVVEEIDSQVIRFDFKSVDRWRLDKCVSTVK